MLFRSKSHDIVYYPPQLNIVTGTDYCTRRSRNNKVCIWCVLLTTAFQKIYPIPKIRNILIYRLAYSIAMYRIARFLPIHSPTKYRLKILINPGFLDYVNTVRMRNTFCLKYTTTRQIFTPQFIALKRLFSTLYTQGSCKICTLSYETIIFIIVLPKHVKFRILYIKIIITTADIISKINYNYYIYNEEYVK